MNSRTLFGTNMRSLLLCLPAYAAALSLVLPEISSSFYQIADLKVNALRKASLDILGQMMMFCNPFAKVDLKADNVSFIFKSRDDGMLHHLVLLLHHN